jgi:hypothetical protein
MNMTEADQALIMKMMQELGGKTGVVLFLDKQGEILGGACNIENTADLKPLNKCNNAFEGKKKLHSLTSITLADVSSSPGHWVICGKTQCWVPY